MQSRIFTGDHTSEEADVLNIVGEEIVDLLVQRMQEECYLKGIEFRPTMVSTITMALALSVASNFGLAYGSMENNSHEIIIKENGRDENALAALAEQCMKDSSFTDGDYEVDFDEEGDLQIISDLNAKGKLH